MWSQVYSYNNVATAFYKASKGKRQKKEVKAFACNLNKNIMLLAHQIKTFTVPLGSYNYFVIKDPKERTICAASFTERVYHHALLNVYHHSFEMAQIEHSYATRPNKGSHLALYQAIQNNKQGGYWLKLDVKKFFDTINPSVLEQQLTHYFLEPEIVKAFIQIIRSYSNRHHLGLPIGNLTSQYFANFYLSFLDHFALNELKIERYIRYMDDIVFWCDNVNTIWDTLHLLTDYLEQELKQRFKPYVLNKAGYPLPFLGFLVTDTTLPNRRNRKKYNKKMQELYLLNEEERLKKYWILHQFYNFKANTYPKR